MQSRALIVLGIILFLQGRLFAQDPGSDAELNQARQDFQEGFSAYNERKYEAAIVSFETAAHHYLQVPDTSYSLYCLKFVGSCLIRLERSSDFMQYRSEILPLLKVEDEEVPSILGLLGTASMNYGDLELAHTYFDSARVRAANMDSMSTFLRYDIANLHGNQGRLYVMEGDYDRAMLSYQHTLVELGDPSLPKARSALSQANILGKMGRACELKGDYVAALKYYRLIEEMLEANPNTSIQILNLNNKGIAHRNLGHFEKALDCFDGELALQSETDNKRGRSLKQIGETYVAMKQPSKARDYLMQGKAFREAEYGNLPHPNMAKLLVLLGECDFQEGRFRKALSWYQAAQSRLCLPLVMTDSLALPPLNQILFPLDLLPVLAAKARAYEALHQQTGQSVALLAAMDAYRLADSTLDLVRKSLEMEGSKLTISDQARPLFEGGIRVANALYLQENDVNWLDQAFHFAEKSRATLLTEAVRLTGAKRLGIVPDSLWQLQRSLSLRLSRFRKDLARIAPEKIAGDSTSARIERQRFRVQSQLDSLQKVIAQDYPNLTDFLSRKHTPLPKEVMARLAPNQSLLEYFVGDSMVYAFSLSAQNLELFALGHPAGLRADIDQLRYMTDTDSGDVASVALPAHRLFQRLVAPVRSSLSGNRLVVIPDGILHLLPFGLLQESASDEGASYRSLPYLLRSFAISYQFSCGLMLEKGNPEPVSGSRISWAGYAPEFSPARSGLMPLSGAQKEVSAVSALFSEAVKYSGAEASKASFLDQMGTAQRAQIVHLACHAKAGSDQESASWIAFSDAVGSDFRLGLEEIYHMRSAPEMMVLSACETGAGPLAGGEGAMSLARGFYLSGSRSVMNTMWQVRDGSSAFLMEHFYQGLREGKPLDIALQQAMLAYLDSEDFIETYMSPHYWAGFRITGSASPMQSPENNGLVWYILAGLMLAGSVTFFFFKRRKKAL